MKNLPFYFLPVFLLVACKNEHVFDENGFYGEGTALFNGNPWSGETGVFIAKHFCSPTDTCYSIKLLHYNQKGELRGDITFDLIPLELGRHTFNYTWPTWKEVKNRLNYSTWASDGDVTTGGYHVYEQNDDNYVELTEVNLLTGEVRGNFQAVVVRDTFWTPTGLQPDTIRISDGSFYGKIYQE